MNSNTNNITEKILASGSTDLYTPEDIMAIMRIGRSSVYKLFGSEGFPSIKMGGILRIEKSKFEKWLNTYSGKSYIM